MNDKYLLKCVELNLKIFFSKQVVIATPVNLVPPVMRVLLLTSTPALVPLDSPAKIVMKSQVIPEIFIALYSNNFSYIYKILTNKAFFLRQ